jgi:DNA (cytosine-5)-methyltransferase 1
MRKDKTYSAISLFSGIGGLDVGLHKLGFNPLMCCELDPNASKTLSAFMAQKGISPKIYSDINEIDLHELKKNLGVKTGEVDLLYRGPPCQAFSLIGKRQSLDDARGVLLFKMAEFAEAFEPKTILIEQVKGLLSASCGDDIKGGVLSNLIARLEALGYIVNYKVMLAADYGVPQLRERLFVVASKTKRFIFPNPTHYSKKNDNLFAFGKPYRTIKDSIADLPRATSPDEPENFPNHIDITPSRDRERINGVPEGECLAKQLHLPKSQRMNLTEKDTTKFRRIAWDLPSLTLRGGEAFYHPSENRYLTPREYLRIHGFDDDFILYGPIKGRSGTFKSLDQHRLVANAVPPKLAEVIGKEIIAQFFSVPKERKEIRALPPLQHYA